MVSEGMKIEIVCRFELAGRKRQKKLGMTIVELLDAYRDDFVKRKARGVDGINSLRKAVVAYKGNNVNINEVDKDYLLGFINFLRNDYKRKSGGAVASNTALTYCRLLSAALNMAVRRGLITENPFRQVSSADKIHANASRRAYLNILELKAMAAAYCPKQMVKQAYLFSCYCGLRLSDIRRLTWKDLVCDGEQWRMTVSMKKTATPIYLPLSSHALSCLPPRKEAQSDALVFASLPTLTTIETTLRQWAANAGVTKHITFHTARHTFATMILTLGADLYTTSKLLGHSNVATTTIYARIVDKKKDEAVRLIDDSLD